MGDGTRRNRPSPRAARIPGGSARRLPRRLAPRKLPRQERARRTVEAILEAAVEVFAARGHGGANTNLIARRAGVSVGSLYQYFPGKDAILTALLARHLASVDGVIRGSLPALADPAVSLREAVRALLGGLLGLHEADPFLARAVEETAGRMPRVPEALHAYEATYLRELERILASRPDVRRGDPALMARLLFDVTEAASGWLAHGGAEGFDRDSALDEATELLCRYVERAPG